MSETSRPQRWRHKVTGLRIEWVRDLSGYMVEVLYPTAGGRSTSEMRMQPSRMLISSLETYYEPDHATSQPHQDAP